MTNGNEKKAALLGMPFGTANGQLRKMLLWHFAKKLEMTICHQCGKAIETIDNFSIEHTEPWMSAEDPVGVFFDVEKIAFSHTFCNSSAAVRPNKLYTSKPEKAEARRAECARYYIRHKDAVLTRKRARWKVRKEKV